MSYIFIHIFMNSTQSDAWTMVSTSEENDTSNKNRGQCFFYFFFHVWEKWYVQSEDIKVCEFHAKIPPFYRRLQLAAPFAALIRSLSTRKVFLEEFLIKKWKASLKLEWNSFVCFTFGEENCREPTKQQQSEEKENSRKLTGMLCFLLELLCLLFTCNLNNFLLKLTLKLAILLKFIHFPLCIHNKQLLDYL